MVSVSYANSLIRVGVNMIKENYVTVNKYLELISKWFGISIGKINNTREVTRIVDSKKQSILVINEYRDTVLNHNDVVETIQGYAGDLFIIGVIDSDDVIKEVNLAYEEEGEVFTVKYPLNNRYIIDRMFCDKTKIHDYISVKAIKKLFSNMTLKEDFSKDFIALSDWYYPKLDKYFDDEFMLVEYGRERLVYGAIRQFPIDDKSKDYLFNNLLKWKLEPIEIQNEIDSRIDEVLSKYSYSNVENTYKEVTMAITPDILADLVQGLISRLIKKEKGVFYSPKKIVDLICGVTTDEFLKNSKISDEWIVKYLNSGVMPDLGDIDIYEVKSSIELIEGVLHNVKIAEPSAGSGEFLVGILNKFLTVYNRLEELRKIMGLGSCGNTAMVVHNALNNALYGVDIERSALSVTKFRLFMLLYNCEGYTSELNDTLNMNIRIGNSLYKDSRYDFSWEECFSKVFDNGGFDIVIGNPPYVGEKGNKELFREICRSEFGKKHYLGKMDLFYFFFHKAIDIAKEGGLITFITTNYYVTANGGNKLRDDMKNRTIPKLFINFNDVRLFNEAKGQHDLITILEKGSMTDGSITKIYDCKRRGGLSSSTLERVFNRCDDETVYFDVETKELFDSFNGHIRITNSYDDVLNTLLKTMGSHSRLGEHFNLNQGLVSGADKLSKRHISKYNILGRIGEGIFVLKDEELDNLYLNLCEHSKVMPFYKNSDIQRYRTRQKSDKSIIYLSNAVENFSKLYPNIDKHLTRFMPILTNRREYIRGYIDYYNLQWSRKKEIFLSEKIVAPQRSSNNTFAYNDIPWFASADVYYITNKEPGYNLKYLTAILNSDIYYLWLYHRGKRKGGILELYQTPLKEIPFILCNEHDRLVDYMDNLLDGTVDDELLMKVTNDMLYNSLGINEDHRHNMENILRDIKET